MEGGSKNYTKILTTNLIKVKYEKGNREFETKKMVQNRETEGKQMRRENVCVCVRERERERKKERETDREKVYLCVRE